MAPLRDLANRSTHLGPNAFGEEREDVGVDAVGLRASCRVASATSRPWHGFAAAGGRPAAAGAATQSNS